MWGAAGSKLTVNKGIGEGKVPGTREGVAVVIFPVSRDAVPWPEVEREPVLARYEMAEGTVVTCIESAAVSSGIRSLSSRARRNGEAAGVMISTTPLRDCSSTTKCETA